MISVFSAGSSCVYSKCNNKVGENNHITAITIRKRDAEVPENSESTYRDRRRSSVTVKVTVARDLPSANISLVPSPSLSHSPASSRSRSTSPLSPSRSPIYSISSPSSFSSVTVTTNEKIYCLPMTSKEDLKRKHESIAHTSIGSRTTSKNSDNSSDHSNKRSRTETERVTTTRIEPTSLAGPKNKANTPIPNEKEINQSVIQKRLKQIGYGKNTSSYQLYINNVPKKQRQKIPEHPVTPDATLKWSTRRFNGFLKSWKLQVHKHWSPKREKNVEDDLINDLDQLEEEEDGEKDKLEHGKKTEDAIDDENHDDDEEQVVALEDEKVIVFEEEDALNNTTVPTKKKLPSQSLDIYKDSTDRLLD